MKVGIVQYPGSNCIHETVKYFENRGNSTILIWHKENDFNKYNDINLLVLPGGFAFGDRYYEKATHNYVKNPGRMAVESPVSTLIKDVHNKGIPIVGICNGFQILTHMGLLPGKLELINAKKFICTNTRCQLVTKYIHDFSFNFGHIININVANSHGRYVCSKEELAQLKKNDQIVLQYYVDQYGRDIFEYIDQNGSTDEIAGIFNKEKNIMGIMPHPERGTNWVTNCPIYKLIEKMVDNTKLKSEFDINIDKLMTSEHISYKSTAKFLKNLYTSGDHVIQGPGENAGIIDIGDGYALALRIESHNHPTFIDPYNGSATGVGGILRDIFTMGARPIAVLDFLRFGTDDNSSRLLNETIRGISDYGNCFGVANVGGDLYRSESYNKNPLVNVAAIGLMKKKDIIYGNVGYYLNTSNNEFVGNKLIYVGAKTGNDGVGGAAMASGSFSSDMDTSKMKEGIQIGDPFLEKLLLEACLEIADNGLAMGMQDMGAGGLLCASLEMVQRARAKLNYHLDKLNLGCNINVLKIPTKGDISDCDKLISESQERMLISATSPNVDAICKIFDKWDLEYSIVGEVTNDGNYTVCKLNQFGYEKLYEKPIDTFSKIRQDWECERKLNTYETHIKTHPDWITYDSTIGGRTLFNGRNYISNYNSDDIKNYSILDLPEVNKKLYISWGTYDTCKFTLEQTHKVKPLGLVNCLNYGHPKDSLNCLQKFVENLTERCKKDNIPVLGGNVSLYNATDGESIQPSPILVMIGLKDNDQ